jgi:DNA (cytosine-5)-methyltransferase 1
VPSTQIPIIGWQERYITKEEGLKLQSLEGIELLENEADSFQALGNAVNAKLVKMIAEKLLAQKNEKSQACGANAEVSKNGHNLIHSQTDILQFETA